MHICTNTISESGWVRVEEKSNIKIYWVIDLCTENTSHLDFSAENELVSLNFYINVKLLKKHI